LAHVRVDLKDSSTKNINLDRVINALDSSNVEIDAWRSSPPRNHRQFTSRRSASEKRQKRIFGFLPNVTKVKKLKALWYEFEARSKVTMLLLRKYWNSSTSQLIPNVATKGGTWVER